MRPLESRISVQLARRTSYRRWLGPLMAAGMLAICLDACAAKDACRSGDSGTECQQEIGGVTLVTACEPPDSTGQQPCTIVSEEGALGGLCGATAALGDCTLQGEARTTIGIASRTTGVFLDQGGGALALNLHAFQGGTFQDGFDIEILAASIGGPAELTVTPGPCAECPEATTVIVNPAEGWIPLIHVARTAPFGALTLSGAGIEIGDLRLTGPTHRFPQSSGSCGPRGVFAPE